MWVFSVTQNPKNDDSCYNKFTFVGDWYDPETAITRKFLIHYFHTDGSIDLFDVRTKRTFLRRTLVPGITLNDFFIGGSVRVFGRLINITDYGCEDTRSKLSKSLERTFAMIKPTTNDKIGEIIQCIQDKKYKIIQMKMTVLTTESAIQSCSSIRSDQNLKEIIDNIISGPVIGMELISENAIVNWNKDMGADDPAEAEGGTLRKLYGQDNIRNGFYGSSTIDDALHDLSFFFPTGKLKSLGPALTPTLTNCTCCIVKPHAIKEGNLGKIIKAITDGHYKITALKMFSMENANASEFYEIYKGVVPDYLGMVAELTNGACVAMEVVGPADVNTPVEFRKLVGPTDPEIARQLRPHTIRARFGTSRIQNAVHCSDLPEDGLLEVEYFFKILD